MAMIRPRARAAVVCLSLVFLGHGQVSAQGEPGVRPARGYVAAPRVDFPLDAVQGGLTYAPDGRVITYETSTGKVLLGAGAQAVELAVFDPPVFGSFLVSSPDGASVHFGESTGGTIVKIPLAGGQGVIVDRIGFNFDLAFDSEGLGVVSAPGAAVGGNSIRWLDGDPGAESRELVAGLSGFSGPVAFDAQDNLYYGTVDAASLSGQRILKFPRELLRSALEGPPLEQADAETFLDELPGFYNLRFLGDHILFTDLGFSAGVGALYAVEPGPAGQVLPIATFFVPEGLSSPSFLAVRPGVLPFAPGAGPDGGTALVAYSDFTTVNSIAEIGVELHFVRGRINGDTQVDMSDAVFLLGHLFAGGPAPHVPQAADVNADGTVDISDPVYLLDFLFAGGPLIPAPFPDPGPGL